MKSLIKQFNFRDESGAVLVLVAIAMVAMLGFTAIVIDGGRLYLEKSKLQKAVDAAVLAGAHGLLVSGAHAESIAIDVSIENGYGLAEDEIDAVANSYIKATRTVEVPMTFAKVLNIDSAPVTASAKSIVGPLKKASGVAPIAVEKSEIDDAIEKIANGTYLGTELLCKKEKQSKEKEKAEKEKKGNNDESEDGESVEVEGAGNSSGKHSPGNCGFLSFDGGGAADLREAILQGGTYSLDSNYVTTEPGGINQAKSAIQELITTDALNGRSHCGSSITADNSCKRVIRIVVIDTWSNTNGRDEVKVIGFASFWLEDFVDTGSDKHLKGRFIKSVSAGEVGEMTEGGTWADLSLYGVKLSE